MAKSTFQPENLLAALPPELSRGLFARGRVVSLTADQTLFLAGDEGDGCYRVEEGLLKASVAAANGGERILAIFGPGAVVGELAMIDRAPRSASVAALRDSKLCFLSRAHNLVDTMMQEFLAGAGQPLFCCQLWLLHHTIQH